MTPNNQRTLSRVSEMNDFLLRNMTDVFILRKIGLSHYGDKTIYAYTVSLSKDHVHSLEERAEFFHTLCEKMLMAGETLDLSKKCFLVSSDAFDVYYYIEAWRKNADKTAYIMDGRGRTEMLNRMSCEQAARIFKKHHIEPFELINTLETLQKYDSYADKYAALAKFPLLLSAQTATKN